MTNPVQRTLVAATLASALPALTTLLLIAFSGQVRAQVEPLFESPELSGRAGLGVTVQSTTSPYIGVGQVYDLLPMYIYEGEEFYLHSYRAGFKLPPLQNVKPDIFIAHRFEGFPFGETPASLQGMTPREPGLDGGISFRYKIDAGDLALQLSTDISGASNGSEVSVGYTYNWRNGPLLMRPFVSLSYRDTDLNNYYYGVRANEQTPQRPEYIAGGGYNFILGLNGQYDVSRGWKLLAGIGAGKLSSEIRLSPIVDKSWLVSVYLGAVYDFEDEPVLWARGKPVLVRVFYGESTDCILNHILTARCASISSGDGSNITGIHFGRPFVEKVNGWPLDFIGYAGALYRNNGDIQDDGWQIDAYMKAIWYGFPWNDTLRTRIGFGAGLSYASRIPSTEQATETDPGENTSNLLNYLDPSIGINVGDLIGSRRLGKTWFGFGVSHRSGVFGSSELLGNVNGGSNYIYTYLETAW